MALSKAQEREMEIEKFMKSLDITHEEAIELWNDDNDLSENAEQEALNDKAKEALAPTKAKYSPLEKVKYSQAKKVVDELKENIMDCMEEFAKNKANMLNAQRITTTKVSFVDAEGNFYSIALTKHKVKPEGYKIVAPAEILPE